MPKTVVVLRNDIVPLGDAIRIGVAKRCGPVLVTDTSLVGGSDIRQLLSGELLKQHRRQNPSGAGAG